ncbi:alpha/beta fold hydrolase [Bacillus coreaensis]
MTVYYKTMLVKGINIFYREAGKPTNPSILLLHGFPSSSHMFRDLINELKEDYHIIAPEYPGFGNSDQPSIHEFEYTFENIANLINEFIDNLDLKKFNLYVHDYGAPIGFRVATMRPDRIETIISQNGNAYEEGLLPSWEPLRQYWNSPTQENKDKLKGLISEDFTKYQYIHGTREPDKISPDSWNMDQYGLNRPGNDEVQLALFYDYQNNLKLYSCWQDYFRTYQPPTLVVWGKNDLFFGQEGARAFQKDLKDCLVILLDTGHFPLEEDLYTSVKLMKDFLLDNFKKV